MSDKYETIKQQADMVRGINLEEVLKCTESIRCNQDKAKWHTPRGVISITGSKFMNWKLGVGGGGAIDLIMHLTGYDFKTAVSWLTEKFSCPGYPVHVEKHASPKRRFEQPKRADNRLYQIKNYLHIKRCIPIEHVSAAIESGNLYADNRGNAVFLLLGKEKIIVGAELRGTGRQKWNGMVPGSRKDLGCFFVKKQNSKNIVLCESAIDAMSYFALHPDCITVSTSGVSHDSPWFRTLINRGYRVYCGFDADETGDNFAAKIMKRYPSVKRIRPSLKDWNAVLKAKSRHQ